MRKDREKAIELRRQGLSYKKISYQLDIPLGTLSGWLNKYTWSQNIRDRLSAQVSLSNKKALESMTQANKERWKFKYDEYRDMASKDFEQLKDNPLFLAGIMLYWGKGDKERKYPFIRFRSGDPSMVRVFYLFLTKTLGIHHSRISANLILYPDLVESIQKNMWSKTTSIPIDNFNKTTYLKGPGTKNRLSYGSCSINVSSRLLKEKFLRWLELYDLHLVSYGYNIDKSGHK